MPTPHDWYDHAQDALDREQRRNDPRPPRCRFPYFDTVDLQWVCCHGGSNCGGCATYPENCRPWTVKTDG